MVLVGSVDVRLEEVFKMIAENIFYQLPMRVHRGIMCMSLLVKKGVYPDVVAVLKRNSAR